MTSPASRAVSFSRRTSRTGSPTGTSQGRVVSNARLAYPIPGSSPSRASDAHRESFTAEGQSPLAGLSQSPSIGPGQSALAQALSAVPNRGRKKSSDNLQAGPATSERHSRSNHHRPSEGSASFHSPAGWHSPKPIEDFDVVKRHLAGPSNSSPIRGSYPASSMSQRQTGETKTPEPESTQHPLIEDEDEFSSLRMQGGDITREIYRRTEQETRAKPQRSQSFATPRGRSEGEELGVENMRQPGGFRREHLRRQVQSPQPDDYGSMRRPAPLAHQPSFVTRNFFEFLSLYGHFAGEILEDDITSDDSQTEAGDEDENDAAESRPLLKRVHTKRQRRETNAGPKKGILGTILILLKSFVGTGVLFLPRAFLNGGMTFSSLVLFGVAAVSYYCFLLLTTSRLALKGSYAEMGEMVHGKPMRFLVNASLVISQIGFASAYIVFTSQNLQAFVLAVSSSDTFIDLKYIILMQLAIFLPLSLYRNLNNIAIIVYIADLFIVLGLIYLYYYGISTLVQYGVADIEQFNAKSWTLFIGTAIFTFEGIGLIIPIQDGMKKPQQLPVVLGGVMVLLGLIFISMGAISYAAYGSKTKTVIILNMPQDNKFVNGVQFLYSLAILLSTPMQIFPAITIMENGLFKRSGKYSKGIKWQKNGFRFTVVVASAIIAWLGADELDRFVALVGSFACIPLVYIYPVSQISSDAEVIY